MLLKPTVYFLQSKYWLASLFGAFLFTTISCKSKIEESVTSEQELVMYQPSEMAKLMNQFYEYNASLKTAIENGQPLLPMPEDFLKIHSAKMTDADGRNAIFNGYAPAYISAQQRVLDSLSAQDLKLRYNTAINLCIACHKTECVGPIPRIKKLLIQ